MPVLKKPLASISLDLDNLWSYLKTHGDAEWESGPSYLPLVVPRVLRILDEKQIKITFFIVGKDAADPGNHEVLRQIVQAGHEIGNHSYHHEPWLHLYSKEDIDKELAKAETAIAAATGVIPRGFRGPGFSVSPEVLAVLAQRGYLYDASTFPTFLGPLARAYYFATARTFTASEKIQRRRLFGSLAEGRRPITPYDWKTSAGSILEIPVTTMPIVKLPIHLSYILYLGLYSRWLARTYFASATHLCRWTGSDISLLLHPLDFLGKDDVDRLSFFPAMKISAAQKLSLVDSLLDMMKSHFQLVTMREHAAHISARKRRRVQSIGQ